MGAAPRQELFVESFDVPWPCGYGAELATIAEFGAYSSERMSANYNPGYEVTPTIYLADSTGRVLWHDGQARPRHLKKPRELTAELRTEIEKALRGERPTATP